MAPIAVTSPPTLNRDPAAITAPWTPGKGINTANDLNLACQAGPRNVGRLACIYFLNGVINDASTSAFMAAKQQGKPPRRLFCVPPNINIQDQITRLTSTIAQTPRLSTVPAAYAVRYVYARNWLCKP